jgi:hypothetical protein
MLHRLLVVILLPTVPLQLGSDRVKRLRPNTKSSNAWRNFTKLENAALAAVLVNHETYISLAENYDSCRGNESVLVVPFGPSKQDFR